MKRPKDMKAHARRGFTLIELMVVVSLIILVAGITLPSIIRLFSAGQERQAYNLLGAQLAGARALAISEGTYTAVHIQPGDATPRLEAEGAFYMQVFVIDEITHRFRPAPGYLPQRLPGTVGVGDAKVKRNTVHEDGSYNLQDLRLFQTISIAFAPDGRMVRFINGRSPRFEANVPIFTDALQPDGTTQALWVYRSNYINNEWGSSNEQWGGSMAVVIYDNDEMRRRTSHHERNLYLREAGMFLAINRFTGELFPWE